MLENKSLCKINSKQEKVGWWDACDAPDFCCVGVLKFVNKYTQSVENTNSNMEKLRLSKITDKECGMNEVSKKKTFQKKLQNVETKCSKTYRESNMEKLRLSKKEVSKKETSKKKFQNEETKCSITQRESNMEKRVAPAQIDSSVEKNIELNQRLNSISKKYLSLRPSFSDNSTFVVVRSTVPLHRIRSTGLRLI